VGSDQLHVLNVVRFFAAVLIGGAAFGALMPGMPAEALLSRWSLLRVLALVLVALAIGLVVRRGWLASATAYVIGIALWLALYVHPSPPWAPSDNWSVFTWLYNVVGVGLAGALLFACIAHIGSRIARLAFRVRHEDEKRPRVEQT
jgi:hypothetical protein